jgi:hypothetical protein
MTNLRSGQIGRGKARQYRIGNVLVLTGCSDLFVELFGLLRAMLWGRSFLDDLYFLCFGSDQPPTALAVRA